MKKYWARENGLWKDDPSLHELQGGPTVAIYLAVDVEQALKRLDQAEALLKLSFDALHRGGYVEPLPLAIMNFIAPLGAITDQDITEATRLLERLR